MKELTVQATTEALVEVQTFVEEILEEAGASMGAMVQTTICVEEIYINIANYAYRPDVGYATIRCSVEGNPSAVSIQFEDAGRQFDPLAKEDADITLSAEEREIGGLGILMVKKTMDVVIYEYSDGKNIFTMKKILK